MGGRRRRKETRKQRHKGKEKEAQSEKMGRREWERRYYQEMKTIILMGSIFSFEFLSSEQ